MCRSLDTDERGMTPVVSKTLAIGIALLYVGGMSTLLFGGVVPAYQTAAGDELADRTLAAAAGGIERSVPEVDGRVERVRYVSLPDRIHGEHYRLELSGTRLTLVCPDRGMRTGTRLSLPPHITVEEGSWRSGDDLRIRVTGPPENRTLQIDS